MHQYLKNIRHKKNLIDRPLLENVKLKINSTQKLKIVDGESFVHYESDPEFVNIIESIEKKCIQYIEEKYLIACTAPSTYILEFDKGHEVNFNYYNGHILIDQNNGNFDYKNTTNCDIACVVFLNKIDSAINFKLLSLNMSYSFGDVIVYPLSHKYINTYSSEELGNIILIHFNASNVVLNDNIDEEDIGRLVKLKVPQERTHGHVIDNTYYPKFNYNHGLLAAMTSILYKMSLYRGQIDNINASTSPGLDFFKKGHTLDKDIYPYLFEIKNKPIPNYSHNTILSHAAFPDYWKLTNEQLYMISPFINKYFSPSKEVLDKIEYYKTKYSIHPDNTIAVYFRGTDRYIHKFEHDVATKPTLITEKLKEIQKENPNLTILLQSDDLSAIASISEHVKNCTTIIEPNFKPSSDGYPIHYGSLDKELIGICNYCVKDNNRASLFDDGIQHAISYIAFLILASQCKFIITHTGHGPLWMLLYRNSLKNFIQV